MINGKTAAEKYDGVKIRFFESWQGVYELSDLVNKFTADPTVRVTDIQYQVSVCNNGTLRSCMVAYRDK